MSGKVTFVASLRDHLTGPAQKATRAVEDLGKATDKASGAAGRYADAQGRLREANGRFVSSAHRAKQGTEGQSKAMRRLIGTTAQSESGLRRLIGVTVATGSRMDRALGLVGRAQDRLGKSTGPSRFISGVTTMATGAEGAARRIEAAMGRVGKAVGLATTAVAGAAVIGGVNRLTSLESADVKLETMGYDAAQREGIMGTVDKAVTGTPFSLNEAATGAAQYLAAGVTPEDLESRLGTTVDMAGIYDMNLGDASLIMSKVLATGTLQGDEVMQLQERGMPVYRALAGHLGVEQGDVKGLISEGKVTAEDFFDAIAPTVEGGAEKLGNTWKGRFANLRTTLSRSAALALTPLMDPTKELFTGLTNVLKDAAPFFTSIGESLAPGIALAAEKAPQLASALAPLGPPLLALFEAAGDALPGLISGFGNWARILAPVVGVLARMAGFVIDIAAPHLPWLVPLVLGFGALSTAIFGVTIAALGFRALRFLVPLMFGITKATFGSATAMKVLRIGAMLTGKAFTFLFPALAMAGRAILTLGRFILASPLLWIPLAIYAVAKAFEWLYDNVGWVRDGFDWLSDTASTVIGFFDDMGAAIDRLVEEKFPALHAALDLSNAGILSQFSGEFSDAGREMGGGFRKWAGIGEHWGSGEGLTFFLHGAEANGDLPHHADGGWTASGAHKAIVGEQGREFVVNHWASEKLASIPGALPAISRGKLPVSPVPVAAGNGSGTAAAPVVFEQHFTLGPGANADQTREFAAEWQAQMDRWQRTRELTYNTPTARGAR